MAVYDINGNIVCGKEYTPHTDAECTNAFLAYMAEKCALFGMTGTHYENPSGLTMDSYSTPRDAMKLGTVYAANTKALEIWATPDRDFSIKGENARTLSVTNNVLNGVGAHLDSNGYNFLGGKGGSLTSSGYQRAGIHLVEIKEKPVLLSLMVTGQTAYNNINACYKELCDMVKASMEGSTPTPGANLSAAVSAGGGYATCILPQNVGAYQTQETPAELLARENSLSASPTQQRTPASTTKAMTTLCSLDYMPDPYEEITVKTVDISSGSGSTFYDGDRLAYFDAVRIMMMESSNTLANTIARTVGFKILNS